MELSLPPFKYKVKKQGGNVLIFDILRKKFVVLTPEEWVRRFDVVVFDRSGTPWLLVECKAPSVPLRRQVFDQAFRYNITLSAPYVAVTNGVTHFCGKIDTKRGFVFLNDFPDFK